MYKSFWKRYVFVAGVIALIFGLLISRLVSLQILQYEDNLASAEKRRPRPLQVKVHAAQLWMSTQ